MGDLLGARAGRRPPARRRVRLPAMIPLIAGVLVAITASAAGVLAGADSPERASQAITPRFEGREHAPPTAPREPPTQVFNGRGEAYLDIVKPDGRGPAILEAKFIGGFETFVVEGGGQLLVNTTGGAYEGTTLLDPRPDMNTTRLHVSGVGLWHVEVRSIHTARVFGPGISGEGDEVVGYLGKAMAARFTNIGKYSNFIVQSYDGDGSSELLVNSIGGYNDVLQVPAGAVLVIRTAGAWSITRIL